VLLNVTDDHLDRYSYFEAYAEAKANIFKNQVATDSAVIPFDDRLCRRLAEGGKGTILAFGGDQGDVRPADGRLVNGSSGLAFELSRLRVSGGHNVDNACAAALAARAAGVDVASVEAGLAAFKGLPHRMEWVQMVDGVTFYDDSKATNVGATVAALDGMGSGEGKVVLIAGGRDKGGSYAPIRDRMERVGRAVVLLGEAAAEIERAFQGSSVPLLMAKDMDEAVSLAAGAARAGDSVLLAPACSSYDMFTSYVERGHAFQGSVRRMEGKGTTG
ncbi:MAG: UDP-N-acetylmuramoyl-L-alanine--D-glutamate ligase, partial [Myxococcales bacterium]|nr:UDP-N-acetylmuramoyl-L-alanine--D-glutamate ligase [Myxococcales bacterium]